MLADVQTRRIALAQIAPRLGSLEVNLATHHDLLTEAREAGADLVVFPELGLTGYQLQDLASEVAMRLDDPRLAKLAVGAGFRGVVASGRELAMLRTALGSEPWIVVPGIRAPSDAVDDQARTVTAGEAVRWGATHLVVGRPITRAPDPRAVYEEFLEAL